MRKHVRSHILLVAAVVLLMFILVPVAVARPATVVTGAGAGSGLYSTTVEYRVHFTARAGGMLWVDISSLTDPDLTGAFSATLDKDGYAVNEYGFSTVGVVVESANPTYFVGRQFVFACSNSGEEDYLMVGDWFPVLAGRGHLNIRY